MRLLSTDVLIIGGGLAALTAAHTLYAQGADQRVLMLSQGRGASPWVHGFNVPLLPEDSVECFYQDVRRSGYRQNDPALARALCADSEAVFSWAQGLGVSFNRTAEGGYQLLRPLGASHPRVASIGNETGPALMRRLEEALARQPGFSEMKNTRALRLFAPAGRAQGALCWDAEEKEFFAVSAASVLLCCGGFGRIYPFSTNRPDGGGDGIAMAFEAGAELVDLEFVQFEPSAAVWPQAVRGQGMITTLFYEGAVLKNALGQRFMLQYGPQAERVDKDVLARCIAREIQEGRATPHGGVWFDATGVPAERLETAYPLYVSRYRRVGIELSQTPIELAPAPHTTLGGVMIDPACHTTLPGLLAAGEVTGGIHGANRLGGNGGLETLVFGLRAGKTLAHAVPVPGAEESALRAWAEEICQGGEEALPDLEALRGKMEAALQAGASVLRTQACLESALQQLIELQHALRQAGGGAPEAAYGRLRLENDLTCARLLLLSALERRESVGCQVRLDAPEREKSRYRVHVKNEDSILRFFREDWNKQAEEE